MVLVGEAHRTRRGNTELRHQGVKEVDANAAVSHRGRRRIEQGRSHLCEERRQRRRGLRLVGCRILEGRGGQRSPAALEGHCGRAQELRPLEGLAAGTVLHAPLQAPPAPHPPNAPNTPHTKPANGVRPRVTSAENRTARVQRAAGCACYPVMARKSAGRKCAASARRKAWRKVVAA
eukprot:scaffold7876_cov417-Prasinococcus_capsulatus_cf.AAC.11